MDNPWNLPSDFTFGASTASYQIEGAVTEGGRGPSIWDTFCAEPGRIVDGSSGADGLRPLPPVRRGRRADGAASASRATASRSPGPASSPTGTGRVNAEGLAFYDRLVDELLAAGIEPMATLYHWDLPQPLQDDAGGWLNRDTAERFGEYAAICGDAVRRPGRAVGPGQRAQCRRPARLRARPARRRARR